jgi:glycosyltransferase involved in cell wall biosynthesis
MLKLSVIIPNYNKEKYIASCLDSILQQTYNNYEILIVDDCSLDHSSEILNKYQKKFPNIIKPIYLDTNRGVSNARNIGIENANGEYVTFIDSDDIYYNNRKLENEMNLIQKYEEKGICIASYSTLVYMNEQEEIIGNPPIIEKKLMNGNIYDKLYYRTFEWKYAPRDICVKKDIFLQTGRYDENMNLYEDYDLFLRIAAKIPFYCTNDYGTGYRKISNGLSSQNKRTQKESLKIIYNQYRSLNPWYKNIYMNSFGFLYRNIILRIKYYLN